MSRDHEQFPAPSSGEPEKDSDHWKAFEAELFGGEAQQTGKTADDEMRAREEAIRRSELLERVYQFSDLLVHAPDDFPNKRYLEYVAGAAANILDGNSWPRRLSVRDAIQKLEAALKILRPEKAELDREWERRWAARENTSEEEGMGDSRSKNGDD